MRRSPYAITKNPNMNAPNENPRENNMKDPCFDEEDRTLALKWGLGTLKHA